MFEDENGMSAEQRRYRRARVILGWLFKSALGARHRNGIDEAFH
jgi:hypothetical protein